MYQDTSDVQLPQADQVTADDAGQPGPGEQSAPLLYGDRAGVGDVGYEKWFEPNPDEDGLLPPLVDPTSPDGKLGPVTTKVLQYTVTLAQGADPVRVFTADPNRKELFVVVYDSGTTSNRKFSWASDKSSCYSAPYVWSSTGQPAVKSHHHTGEVWVYIPNQGGGQCVINAWSVTL